MFLNLSVILFTDRSLSRGNSAGGGGLSRGCLCQGDPTGGVQGETKR